MKYLKSEFPLALAFLTLALGFSLEHSAVESGGAMLWGLLLVILSAIIGVAFRIAHHAEVLAIRFGEPYGTMILTLAAVSVEVVILVVLLQGAPNPTLARDTVFAAIMFDINGILGLAAIVGGLKHGSSKYNLDSANSFIAMLLVAIGIGMFIPDFVPEAQWQIYSVFSVCVMVVMYMAFLRLQTVEHRTFFEYTGKRTMRRTARTGSMSPSCSARSCWSDCCRKCCRYCWMPDWKAAACPRAFPPCW